MCSTPLGSPTAVSNWSYVHVRGARDTVFVPGTGMSTGGVWVPGWVYRVGILGVIPGCTTQPPRARAETSTAVQRPQGAGPPLQGEGGTEAGAGRPLRDPYVQVRPHPTPAGPGRYSPAPGRGLPGCSSSSWLGRHLRSFPRKLVKTRKCHQKVLKRPVIVPDLQNGSGKSPLDFLGFPILPAFSCKELMGLF